MNNIFLEGFSIVLCSNNGQNRLEPTLVHLAALHLPKNFKIELIVVNNASTDRTEAFVEDRWKELGVPFPLHILQEHRPGKGYAVEKGYNAANYTYILTVDDDNWLDDDYLINAVALLKEHPEVGILQGKSIGVFEAAPPKWAEELKQFFIIGSPVKETGYFPDNNFHVWGAGMIIKKADWDFLRKSGFAFLTSKVPGKAAGEDNETAIGLLLLGRKIYYSDKLKYKHFIPAGRVQWNKLKQNFEVYGYVSYYYFLYGLVFKSIDTGHPVTFVDIVKSFFTFVYKTVNRFTFKQHLAYWVKPQQEGYQLYQAQMYSQIKWFFKLLYKLKRDVGFLQSWITPLVKSKANTFKWPL